MSHFLPFATPWPTPSQSGYMMLLATASRPITSAEFERLAALKGIKIPPEPKF